jgi:hypothetical protein
MNVALYTHFCAERHIHAQSRSAPQVQGLRDRRAAAAGSESRRAVVIRLSASLASTASGAARKQYPAGWVTMLRPATPAIARHTRST